MATDNREYTREDKDMKKTICVLMLIILLLALCGCGIAAGASYPNADKYSIGSFAYDAAKVNTVEINWSAGRVELKESEKAELSVIETTEGLTQDQSMRWWMDGSTLRIQYWKSGYVGSLTNKEKRLTVEIPKDISLNVKVTSGEIIAGDHQLKDLFFTATSGEIKAGAVNAGEITVTATSGGIEAGPLRADKQIRLECTSGNIRIDNAMADTVTLKSTSGAISAGPIDAKAFTASNTSGNLKLEAVKAETAKVNSTSGSMELGVYQCGKVDVNSTSGDIILTAVHGSGITLNFKTSSGDLNGKSIKDAQQVIGNGASTVTVKTTSGDLKTVEK